jgi:D-alanyl-D-alanine carboxypeptidase
MRMARAARVLALAAVLGAALLAVPGADPMPVSGVGPLPTCRLDDVLTEPRGYDDWATTLVDWNLAVGRTYKPTDLVSIFNAGVTGGGLIREVAFDDLKAMATAARKAGVPLGSVSAFRSYAQQNKLFATYAQGYGFEDAITFSARPGHSEHQLGLVIDFAAAGTTTFVNEETPTGAWLAKNGWKYGWLMSYPDGKDELVCYHYEPWHYRYVGRDLAEKIHDSGLTIREYLWANFTQLDSECVAAPEPTIVPLEKPVRRSCSLAEPSPSAPPASEPAASHGPGSSEGPSAPPGGSPAPGSTPAPSPTGALEHALPIGIALVVAVAGMLGFILWRNARRSTRYR